MESDDLREKEALQAAVRQVADEYLRDPNITSIGIGWKETGGESARIRALKFTVGEKFAPEALEAAGTKPIPETITANGITFATDVVERKFEAQAVLVSDATKSERKKRVDPMVPGVSIGHVRTTAGTLGCFVEDRQTGMPLILSNWHVLQGETGELGDPIAQPGPFDDNRVDKNHGGVLVRSFLGLAGDCALARPVGRQVALNVLDLGVPVRKIGDPELDDRVVKSGRTTDVTHGIVTRIHTVTKLRYGTLGIGRSVDSKSGPIQTTLPQMMRSAWGATPDPHGSLVIQAAPLPT